ncbi:DUF4168 domain-containing protein [Lamprobacter modestohalophilus]|uniref:DUF4168 domain-containing protein n=1 Tax=Lamprobacter modestohalophilus TaxID=1064514 RepID=UPI002ADEA8B7|nr:DUF4168 domain-containing protein [Lamprobacter modestohalophilus]MEA1053598.1 DUF4168 domain-containing protein [Lamprobacter modestohalophilus]
MTMMTRKHLVPALALTALLAATGTALAQPGTAGQAPTGQGPAGQGAGGAPGAGYQAPPSAPMNTAPMNVDDSTVSNFADAFLAVQEISEDLTDKLSDAPSAEAAQSLQRETQDEMAQKVEETGISVEQYNEIAISIRRDPKLAERVKTAVDQAR